MSSSSFNMGCSFFKIIISNIGEHSKLTIPKKFVRKYENELHDGIFLKARGGSEWGVKVVRYKGEVWLQNGWPEFAKFYGIGFGHLLVFKYRGCSILDVLIFDTNATEIDYPLTCGVNNNSMQLRKRVIEIADSDVCDLLPHKKMKAISVREDEGGHGVNFIRKTKQQNSKGADVLANTEVRKTRAVASAQSSKSNNPFFTLTVSRSHLDGIHGAHVKKSFKESYKMWKSSDQVILLVAGSTWNVECKITDRGCRLANGWDKFARDNLLIVGDVCVFELINPSIKLLQVSIFPAAKNLKGKEEKMLMRVTSENEETRVPAISAKAFESPLFKINMQPTHVSGQFVLSVPKKFIDRYISKDGCNVTLQVSDGRAWSVKCVNVSGRARFGGGWRTFVRANDLVVGDVCVFQLINQSEKLLNVVILRTE